MGNDISNVRKNTTTKGGKLMRTEVITRKDGIVYERKKKDLNFDCRVNIKCYQSLVDRLKEVAEEKGMKYQPLVREILEKYLEEYSKWN